MLKAMKQPYHTAEFVGDTLYIRRTEEQTVVETRIDKNGVTQTAMPLSELIPGYNPDVFHGRPDDDGTWWLDIDCGFQRWHGYKPEADVKKALLRCGFTAVQSKSLISEAHKLRRKA